MARYVIQKSNFSATIVDTQNPKNLNFDLTQDCYEGVCDCLNEECAELVCNALNNYNAQEHIIKSFRYHFCAKTQLRNNDLAFFHGVVVSNISAEDEEFYEKTLETIAKQMQCDAKNVVVLSLSLLA